MSTAHDEQIAALKAELAAVTEAVKIEHDLRCKDIEMRDEEIRLLRAEHDAARSALAARNDEERQEHTYELSRCITLLRDIALNGRGPGQFAHADMEEAAATINALKVACDAARAELAAVTKERDGARAQLDMAESVRLRLQDEITKVAAERDAAFEREKETSEELETLRADIEEHLPEYVLEDGTGDMANHRERVEYAGDELRRLRKRAEEAEASAADRHDKLVAVLDGAADAGRALLERHAAELKAKDEEIARLKDIERVHSEKAYKRGVEAGQAELANAHEEIARLKAWGEDQHTAVGLQEIRAEHAEAELASAREEIARLRAKCAEHDDERKWAHEAHKTRLKREEERDARLAETEAKLGAAVAALLAVRTLATDRRGDGWVRAIHERVDAILADADGKQAGEAYSDLLGIAEGLRLWRESLFLSGPPSGVGAWIAREIDQRFPALAAVDARRATKVDAPVCWRCAQPASQEWSYSGGEWMPWCGNRECGPVGSPYGVGVRPLAAVDARKGEDK